MRAVMKMGGLRGITLNGEFAEMSMRDEFERIYKSVHVGHRLDRDPVGSYVNIAAQVAWEFYQAARSECGREVEPVAFVCKTSVGKFYGDTPEEALEECRAFGADIDPGPVDIRPLTYADTHYQSAKTGVTDVGAMADVLGAWVRNTTGVALTHLTLVDMVRVMLATTPQPQGDGWIKCSERLPGLSDGDERCSLWVSGLYENTGNRFVMMAFVGEAIDLARNGDIDHFMPTGLKRPQPPKEQ